MVTLSNFVKHASLAAMVALVAGCAQPWQSVEPGADQSTLIARLGPPRETYNLPDGGKRLMWPTQPMGTTNTVADIDASGKVVSVRQVMQASEFYRAKVNEWTRNDVLINFGRPAETAYFSRMQREVWSYRYIENNTDYMMFHFYFDDQGILRLTQKTPDPMRDRNLRRGF
jgi:hypothetical protein